MPLEEMGAFFNSRIDMYEDHMLSNADWASVYLKIARLIPAAPGLKILDLGCGTGPELDEIFKIYPTVRVTGIDLAEKLLEKLAEKHADRKSQLDLVLADYFEYDFRENTYDVALSVQSLHHFTHQEKIGLYKRLYASLKPGGFYIESDYMVADQETEDFHFAEARRIRSEEGKEEGYYHYDTPCTVANQVALLQQAGFAPVEIVSHRTNGATLLAKKGPG
jgi:tRNA (cmo5U34)-methyltransferase